MLSFIFFLILSVNYQTSVALRCTLRPKPEEAFEILNPLNCTVYIADNTLRQVSWEDFRSWTPSNLWLRNPGGIRFLTFEESCLASSPGHNTHLKHHVQASEPWSELNWVYLANGCAGEHGLGGCFPESCNFLLPKDGSLKWNEISKCHYMKWAANRTITILTSPLGDKFILHATPTLETATSGTIFGSPKYPPGWYLETKVLEEEFLLSPHADENLSPVIPNGRLPFENISCGYVVVSDSAGNSFHRFHNVSGLPTSFQIDYFGEILLFIVTHRLFSLVLSLLFVGIFFFLLFIILKRLFTKRNLKTTKLA